MNRRLPRILLPVAVAASLAGCGSDTGTDADNGASFFTVRTSPSATADSPPTEDVDPASFLRDGTYLFSFSLPGGGTRTCAMGDDAVTCSGTPPADAPDITVEPFPTGRPGAVHLDSSGNSWTIFEGVPPAKGMLQANQRITVGGVSCEADSSQSLHCSAGTNGFDISGSDAEIRVRGVVVITGASRPSVTAVPTATTEITENYASNDEPVTGGAWCGVALAQETSVYVDKGPVGCLTAESVIDSYRSRRSSEGGGNTLAMTVDGWACSMPTAVRSQELGSEVFGGDARVAEVCEAAGKRLVTRALD